MPNVLQFTPPDDAFGDLKSEDLSFDDREFERPSISEPVILDVPAQTSWIRSLQIKARQDIRELILMLDLAVMRGRLANQMIDDQETKHGLEADLTAIEELLDLARIKAANL